MSSSVDESVFLRLVETFDRLGSEMHRLSPAEALEIITDRVLESIPSADAASISRVHGEGDFETVAPTSELALAVDEIQYDVGSGPCVDAAVTQSIFLTGDLRSDERWPVFGARAADETGVLSMLAFRMFLEEGVQPAALNLYATEADAFDERDRTTGLTFATYGALAITSARRLDKIVNLERALATNRDIGVAIGVLMALHRVTRDQAFDLLRMASQARQRKLVDIAREVADTGSLDAF